jgi:hypothetical protein
LFIIATIVIQVMQLEQFVNEAADALSHPSNTATSHSVLRAFTQVSMVSISVLHRTISLNSLHWRIFLCRGSARVLNGWCFVATVSDPSMWPSPAHHRLLQQPLRRVLPAEGKHPYGYQLPTSPRRRSPRRRKMRTSMCT